MQLGASVDSSNGARTFSRLCGNCSRLGNVQRCVCVCVFSLKPFDPLQELHISVPGDKQMQVRSLGA